MPVGSTAASALPVRLGRHYTGDWCNGNTTDSKPVNASSILVSPAPGNGSVVGVVLLG